MSSTWTPAIAVPVAVLQKKYAEEREKRLRPEGPAQFVDLAWSNRDPWADHAALDALNPVLQDGDSIKFLILGAGYSGLLFAVRLIQAGFSTDDICFVDAAGGFGGTWYWNRYPGLMCDAESYIYMPLLEETGYVPKHRYSYGPELRAHAERIARQWGLSDRALWRTTVKSATWNDQTRSWELALFELRGSAEESRPLRVNTQFFLCAPGILNIPHLPRLPGLDSFKGKYFHTARWDYSVTGGSPDDPSLALLRDQVVGIIGTGCTAVQVVPVLSKWCKHLFVFQRTPSSVDERGQRLTDANQWRTEIATGPGWQRRRAENFNKFMCELQEPDDVDLVDDAWTNMGSGMAMGGGRSPFGSIVPPDKIMEHVAAMHEADIGRAERIRARVEKIVEDPCSAEKLKAWYPTWCKRPTFHDDYLPAFNAPNVTLVDTDGHGCACVTPRGVVDASSGTEYALDVLLLSTGFRSPGANTGSPAFRANMTITGRTGRSIDEKWASEGVSTLHGVASHEFPNLFFTGLSQAATSGNYVYTLDILAEHVAYVISEAVKRVGKKDGVVIEASKAAEDAWAAEVVARASFFAASAGCTPGAMNNEGERDKISSVEEQMLAARGALWGEGVGSFAQVLAAWRESGNMEGYSMV